MIIVEDLHAKLREAGIPIDGVSLGKDGAIRVDYQGDASDDVKAQAEQIVKDYDQTAEDAKEPTPLTLTEINAVKTVADAKAILLKIALNLNTVE